MKAKVIMLSNDNSSPSKVSLFKHCKTNKLSIWEDWMSMDKNWYGFELYLIDPNAKIKSGDLCIRFEDNKIFRSEHPYSGDLHKGLIAKILATTDKSLVYDNTYVHSVHGIKMEATHHKQFPQLSKQSIKLLVDYYNKNGKMPDEVEVEEDYMWDEGLANEPLKQELILFPKLNTQGEVDITIPEESNKTKLQLKFESETPTIKGISGNEYNLVYCTWLEHQLKYGEEKMYTGKEVKRLCEISFSMYMSNDSLSDDELREKFNKWLKDKNL